MKNSVLISLLILNACFFDAPTPATPLDASVVTIDTPDADGLDITTTDTSSVVDASSSDAGMIDATTGDADLACTSTNAHIWYADHDHDNYGDTMTSILACTPPSGYTTISGDCDDNNSLRHPGQQEVCNRIDDNCNTTVDEGCTFNACGGVQPLLHSPGQPCGICNTGHWVCNGMETVSCDDQTRCPLGRACANDGQCASGNCSNGFCSPEGFEYIPPGTFVMGSPPNEPGHEAQETAHSVEITHAFFAQARETTQTEWRAMVGNNPSQFSMCPDCPVERINWFEAVYYMNRLSQSAGLSPCYQLNTCTGTPGAGCIGRSCANVYECQSVARAEISCTGYRLPTEAEWEYLVRAGSTTVFSHGPLLDPACNDIPLNSYAWYCGNGGTSSHPVALLLPNAWGIYDAHGNVQEWTSDWWAVLPNRAETDPLGPTTGTERITRGGTWGSRADAVRSAFRSSTPPFIGTDTIGFRPVRTAPP